MSETQAQTRAAFVGRWIWGTVVGWVLAILCIVPAIGISQVVSRRIWEYFGEAAWYPHRADLIADIIFLLLTLILMGILIGYAQWRIALRDKIDKRLWISSSAFAIMAGAIGFLPIGRVAPPLYASHGGAATGILIELTVNNTWPITVLMLGGALGLPMGIAQWLVLQKHFYDAGYWLLAVTVGSIGTLITLVAVIFVAKNVMISWGLGCCLSPIVFGAVTGVALYSLLKRSKHHTIEPD